MAEGNGFGLSLAAECWKNAEDLWGDFKHTDFGKIILPFTLLRRLECVLEKSREAVVSAHAEHKDSGIDLDLILRTPERLERGEAEDLLALVNTAPCAVDLQLQTPFGAVALREWAGESRRVLLKTTHGAHLVLDPWQAVA